MSGNSAAIHIRTPHTNVIISYTEGLHLSKPRPLPVLPHMESQTSVRLGSEGHSSISEGCKEKKSTGLEQNLIFKKKSRDTSPWYCNYEHAVTDTAENLAQGIQVCAC